MDVSNIIMFKKAQNKQNSQYDTNYIMFKNRQNLTTWCKGKHINIKAIRNNKKMIPMKILGVSYKGFHFKTICQTPLSCMHS